MMQIKITLKFCNDDYQLISVNHGFLTVATMQQQQKIVKTKCQYNNIKKKQIKLLNLDE